MFHILILKQNENFLSEVKMKIQKQARYYRILNSERRLWNKMTNLISRYIKQNFLKSSPGQTPIIQRKIHLAE